MTDQALDGIERTDAPRAGSAGRGDAVAKIVLAPLLLIFATVLIVFYVAFSAVRVSGESMLPTLRPNDQLLLTRGYHSPTRGDIVIVKLAPGAGGDEIVKRVVAIPGDTVEVIADVAYVNGKPEDVTGRVVVPEAAVTLQPYTVPKGTVFVMGDNRPISYDSRFIGALPLVEVQGKVVAVYAPITRMQRFR